MKLGIIGTGKIANDSLEAIKQICSIELIAIFVREKSFDKAKTIAEKYSILKIYTNYDLLLNDKDIDTVYICLINSLHYEYAKKALLNKKHVILEKPFTNNLDQAEELFMIAERNNCILLEASSVLHSNVLRIMKRNINKLGNIKEIVANFSKKSSRYDNYINGIIDPVFDPKNYGGALRDLNIYNIYYLIYLFGMPNELNYHHIKGYNGIDLSGTLVLIYDSFIATLSANKTKDDFNYFNIYGENSSLFLYGPPNNPQVLNIDNDIELYKNDGQHRLLNEFINFQYIIDSKNYKEANALKKYTLEVMTIIDKAFL